MATTDASSTDGTDDDLVVAEAPRYIDASAEDPSPPRRNAAWLVAAGLVVVLVIAVALVAVTRSPDQTATPTPTSTTAPEPGGPDDDAAPQEINAAAPYDGKASMRLPITVTPNRDLVDGQTVTVSGTGFPPGADLGVIMCTNEAVFAGIAACDIGTAMSSISMTNEKITADGNGAFSVQYKVRFHFSVADPNAPAAPPMTYTDPNGNLIAGGSTGQMRQIDCGAGDIDPDVWPNVIPPTAESDPGGFTCIIAAGMVSDYDKSGGAAIGAAGAQFRTFDVSETHAPPAVVTDPAAPEPPPVEPIIPPSTATTVPPGMVTSTYPTYEPTDPSTTTTGPPPNQPATPLPGDSTTTTGPP